MLVRIVQERLGPCHPWRFAELRAVLRDTRAMRRIALVQARQRCRGECVAARTRARKLYEEGMARLREAARQERLAARQACDADLAAARGIKEKIAARAPSSRRERKYQGDMKRIERRTGRGPSSSNGPRRPSDAPRATTRCAGTSRRNSRASLSG